MTWTEGRVRSFITSVLRGGFRRWPDKYQALKDALVGSKTNEKTKRLAKHYKCNICKKDFPSKEVQVDHIEPVVIPEEGFVSWDLFIERLFCSQENLQVLCKSCHKTKSLQEKARRKKKEYNDY